MQVDVLIAGGGIAGLLLARALRARGCRVLVANDPARPAAGQAAVGLLNPMLGRRCTLAWQATTALPVARTCYTEIAHNAGRELYRDLALVRVLRGETELAAWPQRSPRIQEGGFLVADAVELPRGFRDTGGHAIAIQHVGLVDAWNLVDILRRLLAASGSFVDLRCDPNDVTLANDRVTWSVAGVDAAALVVADGAGADFIQHWFARGRGHELPLCAVKGETVLVHAPDLSPDCVLIDGHFLAPRGDGSWVCGATQEPGVENSRPSPPARAEFENFLRTHLEVPWAIVDHRAGVRAVVSDQRPVVGRYLADAPVYLFNGLGSRGFALAPWLAEKLAAHLTEGTTLPAETAPSRFAPVPTGRWHAVDIARTEVLLRVQPGETVVDLTVGNGGDTVWLANAVGARGRVYGFDVQPTAIAAAQRRLEQSDVEAEVQLLREDHARLAQFVRGPIGAAVANLGHLPGSDSPIITRPDTTLTAFAAALKLLRPGGVLVAVVYVGHDGGKDEHDAIVAWAETLDRKRWCVEWRRHPSGARHSPAVLLVEKT